MNITKNSNMNIAMFGHKQCLSHEGGVETVVRKLSVRMSENKCTVTCYDRRTHGKNSILPSNKSSYKNIRIIPVWTIDRKGIAAMTGSVSAAIRSSLGRYDVVHIHAEGPAAMCWLPHLFRKKVVVTVHGLDWARSKWGGLAKRYIRSGEKMAVRYADEIIVLSRDDQNYFLKEYGRKTTYIPNGVRKAVFRDADEIKTRWGLKKESFVLFVGRIVPEKGISYLIDAWKNVNTDKQLVIVGGSSDSTSFMNEMKSRARDNVIFTGFQNGEVLDELYSNAYIYCLPSELEGMPLSLLEAMSYGNCCLVSDIPACTEVVENRAVLFEKNNVKDLTAKLQMLLDEPQTVRKYREGIAEYVTAKYNWDDVVERTLELYRK